MSDHWDEKAREVVAGFWRDVDSATPRADAIAAALRDAYDKGVKVALQDRYSYTGAKELFCSFCGRSQKESKRLTAGPNALICEECVDAIHAEMK